jgi:hypothetical protein
MKTIKKRVKLKKKHIKHQLKKEEGGNQANLGESLKSSLI